MPAEQTNMKVAVRVRPYNKRELEQNQRSVIKVLDKSTLLFDPDEEDDEFFFQGTKQNYRDITKRINKKLSMDFDYVFDTECSNKDIFEECMSPLVEAVLNGYNCSVFVYGATGAGKTFTMLGSETWPGITFLTMRGLFEKIQSQQDVRKFDVGVSYLEVYNEHVMNLLTKTGPLKLREDVNGVVVSGLVLTPIYSAEELIRLLALGNSNRTQHPTDANAESSRSHAIFQVHIRMTERKTGTKRTVKLSMIDLAGSERAASTKGMGVRFKEGASINKSLLALGNCINKLADGLKHIPYRDSNLTRILKDSLGGNCRTLMVANVSMSSLTYEDTYNTLKYASRAKKIRTTLRQNTMKSNMPKEFYVKKVNEVMAENERLNLQIAQLQKAASRTSLDESELRPWYSKIDAVYSSVLKTQEYVIGIRSKIKNLNYRQTLKEDFENFRKILSLDHSKVETDFIRFSGYIANLHKLRDKQLDELPRWRKKLQEAFKDLEKLKNEVNESKYSAILQIYLRSKELEMQNSKGNINNNHLSSINLELVENSDVLRKSFSVACEVLQKLYENLESTQQLNPEIQKLYEKVQRHMCFNEEDINIDMATSSKSSENHLQGKRPYVSNDDDMIPSTSANATITMKRPRVHGAIPLFNNSDLEVDLMDDTDSDGANEIFKKPRNLNETHVLPGPQDHDIEPMAKALLTQNKSLHHQLITEMLSEQNVRPPVQKEKIKQALLKSNPFTQQDLHRKMVAASVQKENLKNNPNCVRKSPRTLMAKALSGTTTFSKKTASRLLPGSASKDPPVVRINRAASFRVKK